ncbi:MAG TPA: tRNA (adenosine(37)-N6)-threonylcarbamoyltransferase complex dimerization subunit type 1 TsaB [Stellaceae bacterium]|nr:tRNA (adenosine(37)-N6)-threonylcarbamoyltransferase complex dimerization subunit type 1 TsaB [Stellaceae bacterium]
MSDPRATGAGRPAPVVLAFDTAGSACSVAVARGEDLLAAERREMRHGHAEALLPMIDRVMHAAAVAPPAIDRVAVSTGPGGFTGIRAGLAAAHGLALAAQAGLVGVTSFAAVAALIPRRLNCPLLIALDSRRDDLYVQLFREGRPVGEAASVAPEELPRFIDAAIGTAPLQVAGDAAEAAAASLAGCRDVTPVPGSAPDARGVLAAAQSGLAAAARALYLRPPDVSFPKPRQAAGGRP